MTQYSLLEIQSIKENLNDFILDNEISKNILELVNLLNLSHNRQKIIRKDKINPDENGKWLKKKFLNLQKWRKR